MDTSYANHSPFEVGGRDRRSAVAADAAKDADAVAAAGRPSQTGSRDVPLTKKLLALGNLFVRILPRDPSFSPEEGRLTR